MKKWNRFLSLALAGALALSLTACGGGNDDPSGGGNDPAGGGEVFEILYAGTSPDTHAMMIAINAVAEEMREESGGRLNMSVFPNNQLGDSRANLESMQTNTIQAGELSTAPLAYFTDLYQPLSLPFFFASAEEGYAFLESDFAQELADKCAEECGFRPVAWFLNGQRALTNSVRAVSSPADMAGLKIRVMENEIYIRTFEALGASPTPMSFAEVFTALQQKTVDGQDNPYALTVSNNFYEVQSYCTDLFHCIDFAPIMVSEEFYQSLPEDLREMFVRYMQKAADMEREQLEQEDAQYLDTIATTCEITLLTEEQRQAFQDACEPVYDWFATEYPELDLQAYMDAVAAPTT